eukprot:1501959-Pyramimonas_sp.AAC.1
MATRGLAPVLGSVNSKPLSSNAKQPGTGCIRVARCVRGVQYGATLRSSQSLCVRMRSAREESRKGLHKPEVRVVEHIRGVAYVL